MKRWVPQWLSASLLALSALVSVSAWGGRGGGPGPGAGPGMRGSGGWGAGSPYCRLYDPKAVVTVRGTVESVLNVAPMKAMGPGVVLLLKSESQEEVTVHLGPSWFLEQQDAKVEPKDVVEVTGSRITMDNKPILLAAQLRRGDEVLKLRDDNGMPLWAAWRVVAPSSNP